MPTTTISLEWLPRLRELTQDNYHALALWYAAGCLNASGGLFDDYVGAFAEIVCRHLLEGEMSDDLNRKMIELSNSMFSRYPADLW